MQQVVDQGRRARQYFSDQWELYQLLVYYPGRHTVSEGKLDTCTVEAGQCGATPLPGSSGQTIALFLSLYPGFAECGQVVCICVQSPPTLQAGLPEISGVRLSIRNPILIGHSQVARFLTNKEFMIVDISLDCRYVDGPTQPI
jgi:hypothetical protein